MMLTRLLSFSSQTVLYPLAKAVRVREKVTKTGICEVLCKWFLARHLSEILQSLWGFHPRHCRVNLTTNKGQLDSSQLVSIVLVFQQKHFNVKAKASPVEQRDSFDSASSIITAEVNFFNPKETF